MRSMDRLDTIMNRVDFITLIIILKVCKKLLLGYIPEVFLGTRAKYMQFILRCFRKMISCVCVMLEVQRQKQRETERNEGENN